MIKKLIGALETFIEGEGRGLIVVLAISAGLAAAALLLVFEVAFIMIGRVSDMGIFGDFVGGVLNPILTFLSFIAILMTVALQQNELKQARLEFSRSADALDSQYKAIERQTFESTLFQMIQMYSDVVAGIKDERFQGMDLPKMQISGKEAIQQHA